MLGGGEPKKAGPSQAGPKTFDAVIADLELWPESDPLLSVWRTGLALTDLQATPVFSFPNFSPTILVICFQNLATLVTTSGKMFDTTFTVC